MVEEDVGGVPMAGMAPVAGGVPVVGGDPLAGMDLGTAAVVVPSDRHMTVPPDAG